MRRENPMTVQTLPMTREDIQHHIDNVWTIEQYLAFLNEGAEGMGLFADVAMWAEDGITTAAQLADYLDGCNARNVEKSERYG